jgi:hypothetical protein
MIKSLLTALAICAFSFSNAQGKINFGAKAGLNLVNLVGDLEGAESKAGIHFGGMAEISINDKFSVQPELLFSTQGANAEFGEDTFNLSYISLPIMAKYYATEALSIEVGPQVGFLVNAEEEFEGETFDIDEGTHGVDFSLNFGLGYKLASGINFSARYNLGLSNVFDFEGEGQDVDVKNSVFQFSIGYFF